MIYTLHMDRDAEPIAGDSTGETRFDSLIAIPEDKATWALIVPPIWLAYYKLWWAFSLYCLVAFFFLSLMATSYFLAAVFLGGLPGLYLLFEGHQLRRKRAEEIGLFHVGTVEAASEKEALERFLAHWIETESENSSVQKREFQNTKPKNLAFGLFPETSS